MISSRSLAMTVGLLLVSGRTAAAVAELDEQLLSGSPQPFQFHVALFDAHVVAGGRLDRLLVHNNHPNRRGHELVAAELLGWFSYPIPAS